MSSDLTITTSTVVAIQGNSVSSTTPTTGQVLMYDGSEWAPANATGFTPAYGNMYGPTGGTAGTYNMIFENAGASNNITIDTGTGVITISETGIYMISYSVSFVSGQGFNFEFYIAVNDTQQNPGFIEGPQIAFSTSTILSLNSGDTVQLVFVIPGGYYGTVSWYSGDFNVIRIA